jgi:hypothetical protein
MSESQLKAKTRLQQYSVRGKVLVDARLEGGENVGFGEILNNREKDCLLMWRGLRSVVEWEEDR